VQSWPVQRHHPSTKQVNARASIHGSLEHFQSVDWLRDSGTAKMPQLDKRVRHQVHAVMPLLNELEPQQQSFESLSGYIPRSSLRSYYGA
jgi:hypothetical protein